MSANEEYYTSGLDIKEELPVKLWETYSDADLRARGTQRRSGLAPGMIKFFNCHMAKYSGELKNNVLIHGPVFARLKCNRSNGTLSQGALTKNYTLTSITATAGSTSTLTHAAKFVADEEIGNYLYLLDDVGAAGAAPEGQVRQIIKNTVNVLTVQPAFSVAVASGDTAEIFSYSQVIAAASGNQRWEVGGVIVAPDGVPDNYWGWEVFWGPVSALVKTSTAITKGKMLIADAGRLTISSSSLHDLDIAVALGGCTNDTVVDMVPVFIDCFSALSVTV